MDKTLARRWHDALAEDKYAYRFRWMGIPIYQEPQDMVKFQELVWTTKPDLIIETGIARGGSLVFSASMLALLDMERHQDRRVIGVDVDIRQENLKVLLCHPLYGEYIQMYEGNSLDQTIIRDITNIAKLHKRVMVMLDSNHTHNHVLAELEVYAPLVTKGCYCIVCDTGIEDVPDRLNGDRPWGKGNNPKTAVYEFLETHKEFAIDKSIEEQLIVTASPDGWLQRVS